MGARSLLFARPVPGGLLVPGDPPDDTADLLIASDWVRLSSGDRNGQLAWTSYVTTWRAEAGDPDGWGIVPYLTGRRGPVGTAVSVSGPETTDAVREVLARTSTAWGRFRRLTQHGAVVAVTDADVPSGAVDAERDTLAALCDTLATVDRAREALRESARVERLARDLASRPLRAHVTFGPFRRAPTEVVTALTSLGFRHRILGRPLPTGDAPPVEHLVDRVATSIADNPYCRGFEVGRKRIERYVRRYHADVTPWPFHALFD